MKNKPVNEAVNDSEARYAGTNWDEPVVRVKKNGPKYPKLYRKVLTKGEVPVLLTESLSKSIVEKLRQGREVRLEFYGYGPGIRLFPCMDKECEKMNVIAQTIGEFRECLSDKKVKIIHGNRELSEAETAQLIRENTAQYESSKRICVSPDTMVTCPECGTEFRVGKQLG